MPRTKARFALVLLLQLLHGPALAAPAQDQASAAAVPAPPAAQRAAEPLRSALAARRIPGLSVAVGHRGRLVWAESFGVADLETRQPLTTESVFPIGSTSKTLTSLALGILVEEGKLDLDAPIQRYVPYFPDKATPEAPQPITARLLAGHLAGLRDYDMAAGEYANTRRFRSVEEAVGVFAGDSLLFPPGTRHAYSAYSFVLLSAAIEGASGRDFLGFVAERVLAPVGLGRTGPLRWEAPPAGLVTGYSSGVFGLPTPAMRIDVSNKWAAGGFVSTPSEMVRLGNAVLLGQVVKPETFVLLTTPQKLRDGGDTGAGYAMGWRSGRLKLPQSGREVLAVHHGGVASGAMSFFVLFPEEQLVVALQGNLQFEPFTDFSRLALLVAEAFLPS